ncbi:MAG: hypothetical protein KF696_08620 [Planctomycetes bacterium]|nr:hypothetical protein [Planctomycetota bacterium]MCW8135586.1 hypothetical protein [Planctomycetota bacterium]
MRVAITATSVALPDGEALSPTDEYWPLLVQGRSLLAVRPHTGADAPAATLPPAFAGRRATSLAHFALRQVWRMLPARAALVIATTKGELEPWLEGAGGDGLNALAAQLADMGLKLPALTRVVSNACVSGAQAVIEGLELVQDGDADAALVLGADALTPFVAQGFHSLQGDSASGARPFDAARDGLSLGEAAAALLLQPGPGPHIAGYGASNDANHISGPSRDGSGLALAMERALHGLDRSSVVAICAHGTGTLYNDAMEARAFHAAFDGSPPPVFGIKGAIGHTLGAAGLIEVIVAARVACTGVIPPTAGYTRGETEYALDVVHGAAREVAPGLVLTTNSGFGGMNTAIVVSP